MYARFASHFYRNALAAGYRLMGADASGPSEATYFHLQKIEQNSTFIFITVCDTTRADWQGLLAKDTERREQAENLLNEVKNIALVYLLVEPEEGFDAAALPEAVVAPYEGQPIYSVLQRVKLDTGQIGGLPGQPSELFGIKALVKTAYEAAITPDAGFNALAAAESLVGGGASGPTLPSASTPSNIVPIKKSLPKPTKKKVTASALMNNVRFLQACYYPKYEHAYIVYGLIAANLAMLIAMIIAGGNMNPSPRTGYDFGAIHITAVLRDGEWWRLFTAMFVHFGIHHFAANTFGMIVFGTRVERYFGRVAFLCIYFISGLMGSVFSLVNLRIANATGTVSGGASGAVYGLVAAVFIFTRLTRRNIETLNAYTMAIFIVIGLVLGFAMPGIDNAGHIGGMVGGALVGLGMLMLLAHKQMK